MDESGSEDWLEGTVFDDAFVEAAEITEASAAERFRSVHPSQQPIQPWAPRHSTPWEFDAKDLRDGGFSADEDPEEWTEWHEPVRRRRRSRFGSSLVAVIVVIAVLGAYAASQLISGFALRDSRRLSYATYGNEDPSAAKRSASSDDIAASVNRGDDWPPAPQVKQHTRLTPPLPVPSEGGAHGFLMLQEDGTTPVSYDPCREIRYVVSGQQQAPTEGRRLLDESLAEISKLTGFVFADEGASDERPSDSRPSYQPERYGERWAPVLIAWSNAADSPRLAEEAEFGPDVLGYAGSSAAGFTAKDSASGRAGSSGGSAGSGGTSSDGTLSDGASSGEDGEMVYVSGTVVLDAPDFVSLLAVPGGYELAKSVLLHELAHLVGLNHVDDTTQLMYPTLQPNISEFGAGDRQGLALLGRGKCFPDI